MTHHFLFNPMVCFAKFNYQFGLFFVITSKLQPPNI